MLFFFLSFFVVLLSEMAAKHDSRLDKPLLKPSVTNDNLGCSIYIIMLAAVAILPSSI